MLQRVVAARIIHGRVEDDSAMLPNCVEAGGHTVQLAFDILIAQRRWRLGRKPS